MCQHRNTPFDRKSSNFSWFLQCYISWTLRFAFTRLLLHKECKICWNSKLLGAWKLIETCFIDFCVFIAECVLNSQVKVDGNNHLPSGHTTLFGRVWHTLHKKFPYSEPFWFVCSRIRTKKTPNKDTFHVVIFALICSRLQKPPTLQKRWNFQVRIFFSKCDQIHRQLLRIWSHLLKTFSMENPGC